MLLLVSSQAKLSEITSSWFCPMAPKTQVKSILLSQESEIGCDSWKYVEADVPMVPRDRQSLAKTCLRESSRWWRSYPHEIMKNCEPCGGRQSAGTFLKPGVKSLPKTESIEHQQHFWDLHLCSVLSSFWKPASLAPRKIYALHPVSILSYFNIISVAKDRETFP